MKKMILIGMISLFVNIIFGQTLDIIGNGNLRSGPSTKNEIIGKVTVGMKVKQLEYSNNWYKVEISEKQSGWINECLVMSSDQKKKGMDELTVISCIPVQTKLTFDKFDLMIGMTADGGECLWNYSAISGNYQQIGNNEKVEGRINKLISVTGSDNNEQLGFLIQGKFFINPELNKNPIKEFSEKTNYTVINEMTIDNKKLILAEGNGVLLVEKPLSDEFTKNLLKSMGMSGGGAIVKKYTNEQISKLTPLVNGTGIIGVQPKIELK